MGVKQRNLGWWGEERCKMNAQKRKKVKDKYLAQYNTKQGEGPVKEATGLRDKNDTGACCLVNPSKDSEFLWALLLHPWPGGECQTSHGDVLCLGVHLTVYSFHSTDTHWALTEQLVLRYMHRVGGSTWENTAYLPKYRTLELELPL